MAFRHIAKDTKKDNPYTDEEYNDQNNNLPRWDSLVRPQIEPITAVGSGQPVVLNHDDDEKPL